MNILVRLHRPSSCNDLLTIGVTLAGALAFLHLPVSPCPKLIFRRFPFGRHAGRKPDTWRRRSQVRWSARSDRSPTSPK